MSLSEPTTLLTDYLLATVAAALGMRLTRGGLAPCAGKRLWAAAFLLGAVAAVAGGTVHGFGAGLPPLARAGLWKGWLVGVGLANGLLLSGMALGTLRGAWLRAVLIATAGKLAVYLAVVTRSDLTRTAVWDGTATMVLVLALGLAGARQDARRLGWLALALAVSAAGLAVHSARLSPHPRFNHNDAVHVILAAALLPFYRAGSLLHDRRRSGGGSGRGEGQGAG